MQHLQFSYAGNLLSGEPVYFRKNTLTSSAQLILPRALPTISSENHLWLEAYFDCGYPVGSVNCISTSDSDLPYVSYAAFARDLHQLMHSSGGPCLNRVVGLDKVESTSWSCLRFVRDIFHDQPAYRLLKLLPGKPTWEPWHSAVENDIAAQSKSQKYWSNHAITLHSVGLLLCFYCPREMDFFSVDPYNRVNKAGDVLLCSDCTQQYKKAGGLIVETDLPGWGKRKVPVCEPRNATLN